MITVHEEVETRTWAQVPCTGHSTHVTANVWTDTKRRRMIGFNNPSLWNNQQVVLENGAVATTVRAFEAAVRRIERGRACRLAGHGRFLPLSGGRVTFVTTCGERRTFLIENLRALSDWAQEPDPE